MKKPGLKFKSGKYALLRLDLQTFETGSHRPVRSSTSPCIFRLQPRPANCSAGRYTRKDHFYR